MGLASVIGKILIVLLVFTIIVMIHEFGHYIMAKKHGVLVQEFAVGMGPKLFSTKWGETLYSFRLLPIGGFCMMQEEVGESKNSRSLSSKSVGQRLSILAAGPIMNFLLAFALMFVIVMAQGQPSNVIGEIAPGFPAEEAGIKVEDQIIKVNGIKTKNMQDINNILTDDENEAILLTIKRNDEIKDIEIEKKFSEEDQRYLVGFTSKLVKVGFFEGITQGISETANLVKMTLEGFYMLITGQVGMDQLAGPVGVIDAGVQVWDEGMKESVWFAIQQMFFLGALISANLGIFNLLPLPALDGGRILFLSIEGIRGKPVNQNVEGLFHFVGFVLLILLMIFVFYNDITRGFG